MRAKDAFFLCTSFLSLQIQGRIVCHKVGYIGNVNAYFNISIWKYLAREKRPIMDELVYGHCELQRKFQFYLLRGMYRQYPGSREDQH